jgi:hypothetical protein
MSAIQTLSIEQLDQRLKSGAAFQFWNVLSDQYFNGELIVGSLRVPVDTVGHEASRLGLPRGRGDHRLLLGLQLLAQQKGRGKARDARLHQRACL